MDTVNTPKQRVPLFNIPPVTLFILAVLAIIQCVRVFLLDGAEDQQLVYRLGFVPAFLRHMAWQSIQPWINIVSYALLHFGWLHFIVNVTGMAAFGSAIERAFGARRYLVILFAGIIAGSLTHFIFFSNNIVVLGGISAGLSALFAVVLALLQQGQKGWRGFAKPALAWVVINMVIGLMGMPGQPGLAIGWIAHLGGFIAGMASLPFLFPAYRQLKNENTTHEINKDTNDE